MSCFYSEVIDEANAWIKKINSDKVWSIIINNINK